MTLFMFRILSLFAIWFCLSVTSLLGGVVISEFLASNSGGLATAEGGHSDWIELQNEGEAAVALGGYSLTDDPENPLKWTLPAAELAVGDHVVVFASGDDVSVLEEEWHTNFRLAKSGGYLALTGPDGLIASEFADYPAQRPDISYGVTGADEVYYDPPTPGAANESKGIVGFVSDTKFSVDRGYFDAPIEVAITTETEGVTILYTTDGRVPSKGSVFTGPIGDTYAGPITIDQTTTLRAIAMRDGFQSSNVDTQTYLFLNDVIRQTGDHLEQDWGNGEDGDYEMDPDIVDDLRWKDTLIDDFRTLPVLSIVVEPDEFFSLKNGIYPGKIGQDGIDIAASAELLHPDGKEGFQIDCAVRIVGQTSPQRWKIKKLSMRLRFDTDFGPGTLKYPLYEDPTAAEEFNTLTVDARHNNTWAYQGGSEPANQRRRAQYLRDQTAADLHRAMGGISPHGRYVFAFVNGMFWGMYNLHERPDDAFNATYQGGERDEWEVSRHGNPSNGGVNVSGEDTIKKYQEFNNLARNADDPDVYAQIEEQLEIDDFISYMLVNIGLGNGDWGHKNYYVSKSPLDGKWRFHSWDAEKVFESLNDDLSKRNDRPGPTGIHHGLLQNADYRIRFADAVHKQFLNGGVMSVEGLQSAYRRRTDEIDRAIILESARWGDSANGVNSPYTKEDWNTERDRIMEDYFPQRVGVVLKQFDKTNLMGDLDAPTFTQHGGSLASGSEVQIKKSIFANGDIYYTLDGSDPRLAGGYLSDKAIKLGDPFILTETSTVKARVHRSSVFGAKDWSALLEATFVVDAVPVAGNSLVVSKLNYRPSGASTEESVAGFTRKDFEFLELMNISSERVDLREAAFVRGISFDFVDANLMTIDAGATVLLVKNKEAFELRYGTEHAVAGVFDGSLSNDGERLEIRAGTESISDFSYNDAAGWPEGTDGGGAYLVLSEPMQSPDSSKAESWRASGADDVPLAIAGGDNPGGGDEGLTYVSWKVDHFGEDNVSSAAGVDADADGMVNYLEYLMGSDPMNPESVAKIAVSWSDDGSGLFDVPRRTNTPIEELIIETSRTLDGWNSVSAIALEEVETFARGDSVIVTRYKVLQLTKDVMWTEQFVRVRAVLPPN